MSKGRGPAFPVPGNLSDTPGASDYGKAGHSGMSQRALIATHALAGLLGDPQVCAIDGETVRGIQKRLAIASVGYADALLEALGE